MNGKKRGNWNAAGWLVVIAFAMLGQFSLISAQAAPKALLFGVPRDGLLFYAIAVALFVALVAFSEREASSAGGVDLRWWAAARDWATARSTRIALVVASFAVIYVTVGFLQTKAPRSSYWDAFGLWVLAGALYVAAFAPAPGNPWSQVPAALRGWAGGVRARLLAHRGEVALLAGILLLAGGLRFAALGAIPDVVSGDEGHFGVIAWATTTGETADPFITAYSHSTLYQFIEGGALLLFGQNSTFGLRVWHALVGTVSVLAVYLLGRRMFDRRVALLAALLMAFQHLHVHFSRIIVAGGIQDVLMATLAVWLFWRGVQLRHTLSFVLSGVVVGLHLYLYMGGRLVILFLLAYALALYVVRPALARANTGSFLAFAGAFLVVALPIGLWGFAHPDEFMARFNQVGIFQTGRLQQLVLATGKSPIEILLEQFRDSLLLFNYYPAWGFYWARLPMLDYYTAVLFVLGLAYALWRATDARFLLLHAWFWSAIIGGNVLQIDAQQGAYRLMILLPVAILFAAVALVKLGELGQRATGGDRRPIYAIFGVFLMVTGYVNVQYYFGEYAASCRYEDAPTRLASRMGQYLGTLGPEQYAAYFLPGPSLRGSYIHFSWAFLSRNMTIVDLPQPIADRPAPIDSSKGIAFLFVPERYAEEALVRQYYPDGTGVEFYDCGRLIGKGWVVSAP